MTNANRNALLRSARAYLAARLGVLPKEIPS